MSEREADADALYTRLGAEGDGALVLRHYLAVEGLRAADAASRGELSVELPAHSGNMVRLAVAADDLVRRLSSIFLADESGRRPVVASYGKLRDDPDLRDLVPFHEYFHADTGAGLGASHQTGRTGLVAMLLAQSDADTRTAALRAAAR